MDSIFAKYAKLLVHYSLGLKKDEKLLVASTYLAEPLIQEVYREALQTGAHPETMIGLNEMTKILYDHADMHQLQYVSPMYRYAVEHYDAFLNIRAPFNLKDLQTVDPEKKKTVSIAQAKLKKLFMERSSSGKLKWTLCEFPTDAQAQECGLSRREYEEMVYSACFLQSDDPEARWKDLRDSQQSIVDLLNSKRHIRFLGNGIDISFSTIGRKWINSDGRHNMPSGEIFTSPVEESVQGKVRFSYPGIFMAQEIEDISLEVRDGEVARWDARKGKELLDKILEVPGANRFGEAAIGTNMDIQRFTKNMLFDEKIGGTIHMALGASYPETGGRNESSIHWDLLAEMKDSGEIYADGELIYKKGAFLM